MLEAPALDVFGSWFGSGSGVTAAHCVVYGATLACFLAFLLARCCSITKRRRRILPLVASFSFDSSSVEYPGLEESWQPIDVELPFIVVVVPVEDGEEAEDCWRPLECL